jgi:hypothetical protein
MVGRALSLAAVMLFIVYFAAPPLCAQAQNLEAGKSPSQLFAGTCNACHKSPRGLLRTVSAASLPGFLRQHYTTSGDMAAQLSSFLIANGAGDVRSRRGTDAKPAGTDLDRQGRSGRAGTSQEATRPDVDTPFQSHSARRPVPPADVPDAGRPEAVPSQAGTDRGPDGRKMSTKQRLSKRGRPTEEVTPSREEPQKPEPITDEKATPEAATEAVAKPDAPRPPEEGKSEAAREMPKDSGSDRPAVRSDPVAPVAPAPQAISSAPPVTASSGSPERPAAPPVPATSDPSPAVTASAPPPAPAGPPAPPISQ